MGYVIGDKDNLRVEVSEEAVPIIKAVLDPDNYERICVYGGRGFGKSYLIGSIALMVSMFVSSRNVFARESYNSLDETLFYELVNQIHDARLYNHFKVQTGRGKILGKTPDNIRTRMSMLGLQKHRAGAAKGLTNIDMMFIDEANQCAPISIEYIMRSIRRGLWRDPPLEFYAWNPHSEMDHVFQLFGNPRTCPPKTLVVHINLDSNPFAPIKLIRDWSHLKALDKKKWAHVFGGEPMSLSDDNVFTNWQVKDMDHVLKQMRRNDPSIQPLVGLDPGFSHPCAATEFFIWDRILYITNEAHGVGVSPENIAGLIAGDPYPYLPKHKWTNPKPGKWKGIKSIREGALVVCDEASPGIIKLLNKQGLNVTKSDKKYKGEKNYIKEGIAFLNDFLIYIHPTRCPHTIKEFENYKYKRDPDYDEFDPRSVTEEIIDDWNHHIDGIRYRTDKRRRAAKKKPTAGEFTYAA